MGAGGAMGAPMNRSAQGTPPIKGGGYGMDLGAGMGGASPFRQADMQSAYSPVGMGGGNLSQMSSLLGGQGDPFRLGAMPPQAMPFGQADMRNISQMSGLLGGQGAMPPQSGLGGLYQQASMQGLGAYGPQQSMPQSRSLGMMGGLGALAPSPPMMKSASDRSA